MSEAIKQVETPKQDVNDPSMDDTKDFNDKISDSSKDVDIGRKHSSVENAEKPIVNPPYIEIIVPERSEDEKDEEEDDADIEVPGLVITEDGWFHYEIGPCRECPDDLCTCPWEY